MQTPHWAGHVITETTCFAFRGSSGDNKFHSHLAIQLVISHGDPITIESDEGAVTDGVVIVKPGARHRLLPTIDVSLVFIEPQSAIGQYWLTQTQSAPVCGIERALKDRFSRSNTLPEILATVRSVEPPRRIAPLDARVIEAIDFLLSQRGDASVKDAAAHVGLSEPRLRAIASTDLGVPLAKWVLWAKLKNAVTSLLNGNTIANAAYDGGFADQAHFTRSLRKTIGVTPRKMNHMLVRP